MTLIQTQLKDRIGTLAFDHYAKRNALGADLIAEMLENLDEFAREQVGAVVIRSASDQLGVVIRTRRRRAAACRPGSAPLTGRSRCSFEA